ncbi:polysaccharide biosynthesis C-terminal domain-containing protein, partial [Photobacterium swingsii]
IYKLSSFMLIIAFLFFLIFYFFKMDLLNVISGGGDELTALIISILSFRILSSPFSNLFSNVLIIMNGKNEYLNVMKLTVVINTVITFPLIYVFDAVGLAVGLIIVLWLHTLLLAFYIKKRGLNYETAV